MSGVTGRAATTGRTREYAQDQQDTGVDGQDDDTCMTRILELIQRRRGMVMSVLCCSDFKSMTSADRQDNELGMTRRRRAATLAQTTAILFQLPSMQPETPRLAANVMHF